MKKFNKRGFRYDTKVDFGMIDAHVLNPTAYQRPKSEMKIKLLKKSIMETGGFEPAHPIVINSEHEIICGQHRVQSVKELVAEGLITNSNVYYIMYHFETKEDEILYFKNDAKSNTSLNFDEVYNAMMKINDPLFVIIDKLKNDPDCVISKRVVTKKERNSRKDELLYCNTIALCMALKLIKSDRRINFTWGYSALDKKSYKNDVEKYINSKEDYKNLRYDINKFVQTFEELFKEDEFDRRLWSADFIERFIDFYCLVKRKGLVNDSSASIKSLIESIGKNLELHKIKGIVKERKGAFDLLKKAFNHDRSKKDQLVCVEII